MQPLTSNRLTPRPIPPNITGVQPGGGKCLAIELAWGSLRRKYLKLFRSKYLQKMSALATGDFSGAPHEILDPRDLKFCRNLVAGGWQPENDPFAWRERIPFARWGLAELQIFGWPLLALCLAATRLWWPLALAPGALLALVAWFFRDPPRRTPTEPGLVISPADGTVTEITSIEHDPFLEGPGVRIGIFLSLFNVHVNRAPLDARVIELRYSPGKFLNAQLPESSLVNENMWIGLEESAAPHRRLTLRQVSGLVARRIVCAARPGEDLTRGQKFGMIKLGSRTEIVLPAGDGLQVAAAVGDKVRGGATVLARLSKAG